MERNERQNRIDRNQRQNLISMISESTVIPLGLVCVIISGVFWLASVSGAATKNSSDIADIKILLLEVQHQRDENMNMYKADMMDVSARLGNIEGALGVKTPRAHGH